MRRVKWFFTFQLNASWHLSKNLNLPFVFIFFPMMTNSTIRMENKTGHSQTFPFTAPPESKGFRLLGYYLFLCHLHTSRDINSYFLKFRSDNNLVLYNTLTCHPPGNRSEQTTFLIPEWPLHHLTHSCFTVNAKNVIFISGDLKQSEHRD